MVGRRRRRRRRQGRRLYSETVHLSLDCTTQRWWRWWVVVVAAAPNIYRHSETLR